MLTYINQDTDTLIPYLNNPRMHSQKQINQIAQSISEFGFISPVIVDETGNIIAGHGRLLAAKKLKLKTVPTVILEGFTDDQKKAYALVDNKLGLNSTWNQELLTLELNTLAALDYDLPSLGFDDFINGIPSSLKYKKDISGQDLLTLPEDKRQAKLGDVWRLGQHIIICGDATSIEDIKNLLGKVVPDLVLTDPPYGVSVVRQGKKKPKKTGKIGDTGRTYKPVENDNSIECAKGFYQNCKLIGIEKYIIWGGNYFTEFLPPSPGWLIWDKETNTSFADVELAWTNFNKPSKLYTWLWSGMRRKGSHKNEGKTRIHPTQKPVGMLTDILFDFPGDVVFDGFLGSGSTLIACEIANRSCFGLELDPYYIDLIINRWENFTLETATLIK